MRRAVYAVMIVFVAVAFGLAAWTRGTGWIFLVSLVAAAGMLILVVFLVALTGNRTPIRDPGLDGFLAFEEAAEHARRGGFFDQSGSGNPDGFPGKRLGEDASRGSAKAFVRTLVPFPASPADLSKANARREFVNALHREGKGLIHLAKVTGADAGPYRAFLIDARKATVRGDTDATLRSLQLGNELLRATIEKFLVKRKRVSQDRDDVLDM